MDLGKPTYEEDFERHFLAAAADFYAKEAQEYIASSNVPEYMLKVRACTARSTADLLWSACLYVLVCQYMPIRQRRLSSLGRWLAYVCCCTSMCF
jgi:hypothetical protein